MNTPTFSLMPQSTGAPADSVSPLVQSALALNATLNELIEIQRRAEGRTVSACSAATSALADFRARVESGQIDPEVDALSTSIAIGVEVAGIQQRLSRQVLAAIALAVEDFGVQMERADENEKLSESLRQASGG